MWTAATRGIHVFSSLAAWAKLCGGVLVFVSKIRLVNRRSAWPQERTKVADLRLLSCDSVGSILTSKSGFLEGSVEKWDGMDAAFSNSQVTQNDDRAPNLAFTQQVDGVDGRGYIFICVAAAPILAPRQRPNTVLLRSLC